MTNQARIVESPSDYCYAEYTLPHGLGTERSIVYLPQGKAPFDDLRILKRLPVPEVLSILRDHFKK